ncbi:hypothetical protein Dda_9375 [Drechslerella dactyloides]|uniref:Zn(2)-C6 fungal-type domain-containing protein n=1 Tax=Drechslerella dactyloides TaxID=74499 RepID=A0AAD6IRW8_DREDA|nr:hypothetical protein Dda_9375 [Drechslerella dactyloides]
MTTKHSPARGDYKGPSFRECKVSVCPVFATFGACKDRPHHRRLSLLDGAFKPNSRPVLIANSISTFHEPRSRIIPTAWEKLAPSDLAYVGARDMSAPTDSSGAAETRAREPVSPRPDAAADASPPKPRPFNCIVCKNRKVKCDRQMPCSTCAKLNFDCQYVEPGPRKKRKSSSKHENLMQRLNKYEELLKQVESNVRLLDGVELPKENKTPRHESPKDNLSSERLNKKAKLDSQLPSDKPDAAPCQQPIKKDKGAILTATNRTRYYENNLWNSLKDELQELKETIFDNSSDEDKTDDRAVHNYSSSMPNLGIGILLFGPVSAKVDLSSFHPSPEHCVVLWNVFLDNVNPLTHVIHYPSLGEKVMQYKDHPHSMPRNLEALMFAIYALTILSIDNKQCQQLFGERKTDLQSRYRFAAQHALKNAGLLKTTDLVVLQGLVLFLVSCISNVIEPKTIIARRAADVYPTYQKLDLRSYYDYPSLWVVTGMAVRIAQRMGIHRDGTKLSLPPFETEMRRRLWREILILDVRTAELSGAGLYTMAIDEHAWDSKWPMTINETDIWPSMTSFPKERTGPTENMWCQLRSELGNLWVEKWRRIRRMGILNGTPHDYSIYYKGAESEEQLESISKMLEEKYIRYCDPAKPLHLFTSIVGRAALANLHLMMRHPFRQADGGIKMTQEQKDELFSDAIRVVEYDNICNSTRSLHRYLWHTKSFFQWHAFIYVLGELRQRAEGVDVEKGWEQVDEVFDNHKEWLDRRDELHSAIRAFALKAWECRETLLKSSAKPVNVRVPQFVHTFKAYYSRGGSGSSASQNTPVPGTTGFLPSYPLPINQDVLNGNINMSPMRAANTNISPEAMNMSPPNADATPSTSTGPPPAQSGFTPINWTEWENLLQNSDLLGFSDAFQSSYSGIYGWPQQPGP